MKNFEKHEWDIQQLGLNFGVYEDLLFECHTDRDFDCKDCLFYINGKCNDIEKIKWFNEEYKEQPILDDIEKRYLESFLKPYKNIIYCICKFDFYDKERITIRYNDDGCAKAIYLPPFKNGTCYKNMLSGEEYTLKDLGLFDNEID